uniref:HDC11209 n=1 Tax=Drosophila melanogaster TaxID=7227 RepID=Q6IKX1_DROME|nr:TPA_inf: HDC11209 [Drosophila melanogaster]
MQLSIIFSSKHKTIQDLGAVTGEYSSGVVFHRLVGRTLIGICRLGRQLARPDPKHATQNFNPNFARQLITTWRLALICQNRLSSITAHLSKVKIERKGPHTSCYITSRHDITDRWGWGYFGEPKQKHKQNQIQIRIQSRRQSLELCSAHTEDVLNPLNPNIPIEHPLRQRSPTPDDGKSKSALSYLTSQWLRQTPAKSSARSAACCPNNCVNNNDAFPTPLFRFSVFPLRHKHPAEETWPQVVGFPFNFNLPGSWLWLCEEGLQSEEA